MHIHTVASEEELKQILNSYDVIISYMRHPTDSYIKSLRKDIKDSETQEYQYDGNDVLGIALSRRLCQLLNSIILVTHKR